jgi:hypothetical protein
MGVGLASQEVGLVEVQAKGAFLLVASLEEEEVVEGMRKVPSLVGVAGQEEQVASGR